MFKSSRGSSSIICFYYTALAAFACCGATLMLGTVALSPLCALYEISPALDNVTDIGIATNQTLVDSIVPPFTCWITFMTGMLLFSVVPIAEFVTYLLPICCSSTPADGVIEEESESGLCSEDFDRSPLPAVDAPLIREEGVPGWNYGT